MKYTALKMKLAAMAVTLEEAKGLFCRGRKRSFAALRMTSTRVLEVADFHPSRVSQRPMVTPGNPRVFLSYFRFGHLTLTGTAIVLLAGFGVLHVLGWRDDTAIISGTSTSSNANAMAFRGVLYGLFYFAAVIVSPILVLAAGFNAMLRRLMPRVTENSKASQAAPTGKTMRSSGSPS